MSTPFDYRPEDALHGPVGDLVRRLEPFVPMNTLALYCELMVAVGTIVGRRAVIRYIEDEHFPNLFLIMVGKTGIGKGTSWNVVERVATAISPDFQRLVSRDVASAPGLIALVRDPTIKTINGKIVTDAGVKDKRRLILFEEMEILMKSILRQGSTLDQILRLAWQGKTLENNARCSERATNPHCSTICQITPEAFTHALSQLGKQSVTNGSINRYLIVPVTQERRIHRGKQLPGIQDLVDKIRKSLAGLGEVQQDTPAKEISWAPETDEEWDAFCDAIDDGDTFLEGVRSAYGRLKPMVMRVAMLLAVIDGESQIRLTHLRAAKALCLHLVDSSRHYFTATSAKRSRSPRDRLMEFRPHGDFTLTDLQNWMKSKFPKGRQVANDDLHQLIDDLVAEGIWCEVHRTGSPKHRGWRFAVADHYADLTAPTDEEHGGGAEFPPKPEPEQPPPEPEAQPRAYYLGAPFPVLSPIEGLTLEDRPHAVPKGLTGHLVQLHSHAPAYDSMLAIQKRKPSHRLVYIDGELLLLPLKPVQKWAAAQAGLQLAESSPTISTENAMAATPEILAEVV